MIDADEALQKILASVPTPGLETVDLSKALGRTLAGDLVATEDLPPFANSSMDGYAVRQSDLRQAAPEIPCELVVVGESRAGRPFLGSLSPGSAARIMTGGMLPHGADSVVPVELVEEVGNARVRVDHPAESGQNIRYPGSDVREGEIIVRAGELLGPAHCGVLASLGFSTVRVTRQPRVAIVATGDELVPPDSAPRRGQIRNSTSSLLAASVQEAGGKPRFLGIIKDTKAEIRKTSQMGFKSDILIVTGGVSVGKYDLVKEVLESLGVHIEFWKVNIKPGRPLLFGTFGRTLVFGLPGNPASTGVTFMKFVRPALRKMLGRREIVPAAWIATSEELLAKKDGKRHYLRGIARLEGGKLRVRTTGNQSSGVMTSLLRGNCLIILPEATTNIPAGAQVMIEFFHDPL